MPGLDYRSAHDREPDDPRTASRNAYYGLVLFAIYLAVYGGFVWLNAFRPDLMERTPFAGINLAILYGFGLIGGAFVTSLIYGWLCHLPAPPETKRPGGGA